MFRKSFYTVTLLLAIIIALACGANNPAKEIIGKWVVVKGDIVPKGVEIIEIEFRSNNTFNSNNIIRWEGMVVFMGYGNWTILDDGRIEVEDRATRHIFLELKGNQMIMNFPPSIYGRKKFHLVLVKSAK